VAWWYEREERRIALADGGLHILPGEKHADPTAEAIRWSICEGELIQAIGRGRGINRTAAAPLEIDLLTDVVLPIAVHAVLPWEDICPSDHDVMAARGVILENAADMAKAFPDLWPSREAAKKQNQRRGTNCYYSYFSNCNLSPSSSIVRYRPAGAGQKDRTARFDLALIPEPLVWLERQLGPALSLPALPLAAGRLGTGSREIALRSWKMTGSSPMMSGVPILWMICAAYVAIALRCPHCRKGSRRTGKKRCCFPTFPPVRHVLMILMAMAGCCIGPGRMAQAYEN
jgi:hypothetical protein